MIYVDAKSEVVECVRARECCILCLSGSFLTSRCHRPLGNSLRRRATRLVRALNHVSLRTLLQVHEVKQLDDSLNTTEDYSVEGSHINASQSPFSGPRPTLSPLSILPVMNPPVDVKDPDKYRDFFNGLGGKGGKVDCGNTLHNT